MSQKLSNNWSDGSLRHLIMILNFGFKEESFLMFLLLLFSKFSHYFINGFFNVIDTFPFDKCLAYPFHRLCQRCWWTSLRIFPAFAWACSGRSCWATLLIGLQYSYISNFYNPYMLKHHKFYNLSSISFKSKFFSIR